MTKRRSGEAGFTMLEFVVAMAIMTIIFGLSAFALTSYFRAQALTGSTSQLLTDMRDAQVRAQAEVRSYKIEFNEVAEEYKIYRFDGTVSADPADPANWALLETNRLERNIDLSTVDFKPTGTCIDLAPYPANVSFFCPRGVSSSGTVILRHMQLNQDREITLKGLTSRAEVK